MTYIKKNKEQAFTDALSNIVGTDVRTRISIEIIEILKKKQK